MALNYSTYVTELTTLMVTQSTNQNFINILPGVIDYAEGRIYRELNLLATVVRDSSATFIANNRNLTLPTATYTFVTVQEINAVTPAGTTPENGTRNALAPVSKEYLDAVWNSATGKTVPRSFAMLNQTTILVGPWPDQNYIAEIVGTVRPTPLSATNTTTFLTQYLADLFVAASMIFASGYMRNFGSQADDPKLAMSWEQQYQSLFGSANAEELRKSFAGPGWTSMSQVAAPPSR